MIRSKRTVEKTFHSRSFATILLGDETPANNSSNIPLNQNISLEFSEQVQLGSGNITLTNSKNSSI
ncbi:MAG: Ig-like domain-containing domain [Desulfitobacteriaceae bacterium]